MHPLRTCCSDLHAALFSQKITINLHKSTSKTPKRHQKFNTRTQKRKHILLRLNTVTDDSADRKKLPIIRIRSCWIQNPWGNEQEKEATAQARCSAACSEGWGGDRNPSQQ
eukprot:TRINITY_DN2359_c0_g2_i1.p5 TRINITY_DN2359_c0_g2~~TRINITY_DN2359_c0_g2_i1.p5  ORF type:complete len:111 (-),score=8.30 TRINITY_DN2359_c0_g2_i1:826-1158(-)